MNQNFQLLDCVDFGEPLRMIGEQREQLITFAEALPHYGQHGPSSEHTIRGHARDGILVLQGERVRGWNPSRRAGGVMPHGETIAQA